MCARSSFIIQHQLTLTLLSLRFDNSLIKKVAALYCERVANHSCHLIVNSKHFNWVISIIQAIKNSLLFINNRKIIFNTKLFMAHLYDGYIYVIYAQLHHAMGDLLPNIKKEIDQIYSIRES